MEAFDVSVVGLGFAGLPTAVAAARTGSRVVGLDTSAQRVRAIAGVAAGCGLTTVVEDELRAVLAGGRLQVRKVGELTPAARTHVLCVPTPAGTDGGADLAPLLEATDRVGGCLRRGDLVLVQSTCPPGTVAGLLMPRLVAASGLAPGSGFHLGYSPVRVDPGTATRTLPRVVAGSTPQCLAAAETFLRDFTEHLVPVGGLEVAELAKIFENTFRLVNISLVNELATLCRASGVDFHAVLDAASTKPYGFLRHQPSPGAGGDCIPASAGFFAAAARHNGVAATVVETALALNQAMPAATVFLVRQLAATIGLRPLRGSRILVVGVTYKPDVPNVKQSAAVRVMDRLKLEAEVSYHDPYVPSLVLGDGTVMHSRRIERRTADLVLVLTRHRAVDEASLLTFDAPVIDCSAGEPRVLCWQGSVSLRPVS